MQQKNNEATPQRPEGTRPLDASVITMDLPALIKQIIQEDAWKNSDRNALTVFKTDGMRIVLIALHAEAEMSKHTAEGILSIQVLEGHIVFEAEKHVVNLNKGQMLALHQGIAHSVRAKEESVFLLTLAKTPQ